LNRSDLLGLLLVVSVVVGGVALISHIGGDDDSRSESKRILEDVTKRVEDGHVSFDDLKIIRSQKAITEDRIKREVT